MKQYGIFLPKQEIIAQRSVIGMDLKKFFFFREPMDKNTFVLNNEQKYKNDGHEEFKISSKVNLNEEYVKKRLNYPKNNDIIIKDFTIKGERRCFAVAIEGMVNSQVADLAIIETMLKMPYISDEKILTSKDAVIKKLISHLQSTSTDDMEMVIEEVNFGSCAVFVDGIDIAFLMDVRGWEHRSINKPENEQSIYGPQEAFGEMVRTNSALVRKIIKSEKLICEGVKIGTVSKTKGVLMYIDDIANDELIEEVKRRIDGIKKDYIIAVDEVALFLDENPSSLTNQILATERPDRVAMALADGRVALLLNGSPRALIFPTTLYELMHTATDAYLKQPFANMARFIRLLGMFISILVPGIYLAITLFHQEMIPTYLLYAISASRENVPFPSVVEMLLMNFAFEIIRQAGIQMPGPIGSTLGIVGGLILGQAAVSAKIVSPIMIIIIAITGIGSFATSDYTLSWTHRLLRIIFILLGATLGFYGIAIGIFIYSVILGAQKNFGVSFLSPLPSNGWKKVGGSIFVEPVWKQEMRPTFLKTKNPVKEPKISMSWRYNKKK